MKSRLIRSHSRLEQQSCRAFSLVGRSARRLQAGEKEESRWFCEASDIVIVRRVRIVRDGGMDSEEIGMDGGVDGSLPARVRDRATVV